MRLIAPGGFFYEARNCSFVKDFKEYYSYLTNLTPGYAMLCIKLNVGSMQLLRPFVRPRVWNSLF